MVVMGSTFFSCTNFRHIVPNGEDSAPMESEAPACMPKREQSHTPLLVVNGTRELPGTTHHQLPTLRQHDSIRKRLDQANFWREFHLFQNAAVALGAEQVSIRIQSRRNRQQPGTNHGTNRWTSWLAS